MLNFKNKKFSPHPPLFCPAFFPLPLFSPSAPPPRAQFGMLCSNVAHREESPTLSPTSPAPRLELMIALLTDPEPSAAVALVNIPPPVCSSCDELVDAEAEVFMVGAETELGGSKLGNEMEHGGGSAETSRRSPARIGWTRVGARAWRPEF